MEILKKPDPVSNIILLDEYKIGYVPIPKSGCSSIKFAIAEFLNLGISKKRIHSELKMTKIQKKSDFEDFFIFSIVRNPIDRIYSAYKSKITKDPNKESPSLINGVQKALAKYYGDAFYGGMSFQKYLEKVSEIKDLHADEHFRSQYFTLHDEDGNLFCDYVGNLENVNYDIKILSEKHGLPFDNIGHFGNKANYITDDLQKIYDNEELKKIIFNRYKLDFEAFGYSI